MILSNVDIWEFIKGGEIKIEPLEEDQIGPASVDLTLSNKWWKLREDVKYIDITKQKWDDVMRSFEADEVTLKPQELCLGITKEKITLSNRVMGILEGRSRYARMGLGIHVTSSFVHPGVSNRQVLEIVNNSSVPITIKAGERISQIVFVLLKTPTSKPYKKVGKIAINQ